MSHFSFLSALEKQRNKLRAYALHITFTCNSTFHARCSGSRELKMKHIATSINLISMS